MFTERKVYKQSLEKIHMRNNSHQNKRGASDMKVQAIKHMVRLREWAAQISDCQKSGLTVKQWCDKQGINKKTYYNRVRVVREEMLEFAKTGGASKGITEIDAASIMVSNRKQRDHSCKKASDAQRMEMPEFVELAPPPVKLAAVSVRFGGYAVDIQNNADDMIIEHVLRVVTRL